MKTLSVVYAHHEAHGPQICVIELLSKYCDEVDLLYCNVAETTWQFPDNVKLIKDKKFIPQELVYKKNIVIRWYYFFNFVFKMWRNISKRKYDLIVLFNPPALFAMNLVYWLTSKKTVVWYHNYEPIDAAKVKRFSQGWFAYKAMFKAFPKIDLFSLPEKEREVFFPLDLLKREYLFFPNYSLLELHEARKREITGNTVRLIYAGVVSAGNGLEDIIPLLQYPIAGKNIELILKGFLKDNYKAELIEIANKFGVKNKIIFIPVGPWKEVPEVIRQGNIGIQICMKVDITSKTLGKGGSGKIFQYIAEGLPVLIANEFKEYFTEYDWAVPTDLTREALINNISIIIDEYDHLSQSAVNSFLNELNCNMYFDKVYKAIIEQKEKKNNI